MKIILLIWCLITFQLLALQDENLNQSSNECIACHIEIELMPEDYTEIDIHFKSGILCEDCHGGNSSVSDEEISMSKSNGFIGVTNRKDISSLCGKCHSSIEYMKTYRPRIQTDQVDRYYTSQHGVALKKGDVNVAVCTSCHSAHSILPASDPRSSTYATNIPETCNKCHGDVKLMQPYNLNTKIYEDFTKGVHGIKLLVDKDLGAPSCNDCHGNHGAAPPGVHSISNICGICHVSNANYFKESQMSNAFADMEFHECEECHNNHFIEKPDDKMVSVGEGSICVDCHEKGDEGYIEAEKIYLKLTNLSKVYDSANVRLKEVRSKGMNDIDIEYILKDGRQALIQARTMVHTFDSEKVGSKVDEGIKAARLALNKGNDEIEDYDLRRNGFGAATLAITLLTLALYLKSRELKSGA